MRKIYLKQSGTGWYAVDEFGMTVIWDNPSKEDVLDILNKFKSEIEIVE